MEPTYASPKRRIPLWAILVAIAVVAASVLVYLLVNRFKIENAAAPISPTVTYKEPTVRPRLFATGLAEPTAIVATTTPKDKRLYVAEQRGTIQALDADGRVFDTPHLDIQSRVLNSGEMGLLGLAFHPDFAKNGYLYVNYIDKNQNTIIARFHAVSNATSNITVDPTTEKILLTLKQPYPNHNGGDLAFGPDGYLYAALGDGGSGGDPENRAQDKNSLFGKILRIDVDKGDPYSIPDSNPFVGQPNTKPEIWAYGLRNPWRISFDKATGDLYIADVGQNALEEINLQPANSKGGENYGWRCYEGTNPYKPQGCANTTHYSGPIAEYDHSNKRCSVTGGYVYRGKAYPRMTGSYFYGDYCSGELWYLAKKDGKGVQYPAAKTPYAISTFGQDSDGELYLADYKTGSIYRLEDTVP